MDRHINSRDNPQRYEQCLSPFGKKVLQVLIGQWNKERFQNKDEYQYHQFPTKSHRGMLTFNDNSVDNTPYTQPIQLLPCKPTYIEEKVFDFNLKDIIEPVIPSSVELIKTVSIVNNNKSDFLHPTIAANKNHLYDIYNKDSDIENTFDQNKLENKTKPKDITWDNMLDSELFFDLSANQAEINDNSKTFNIKISGEMIDIDTDANIVDVIGNIDQKCKHKTNIDLKPRKVRKLVNGEGNKIRPLLSPTQKNKMVTEKPKTTFRKQNYTKTVKNWLCNVKSHISLEEDIDIVNIDNMTNTVTDKLKQKIDTSLKESVKYAQSNKSVEANNINISIDKTKSSKKVVQAQLANKDGVMKYSKPKTTSNDIKKDVETKEKQKDYKEKRVNKFVAPIKSQVPVKDIIYEILTVNETNSENCVDKLRDIKNNEILALLTYSNGFCQLNNHYTDGACTPNGIIINYNDVFYYFKSDGQKNRDTLKQLLENNKVVCYEARVILIYLASHLHIEINSVDFCDAKIGASLLDPDNPPENFSDLQKLLSFTSPYTIATECSLQKSAWYMSLLKECWAKMYGMLVEDSLWKVFTQIEMKLLPIIADMEHRGVLVDLSKLKSMEEVLLTRMKQVEQQCYKAAGKVFQINSAIQVRAIIYDELQLDTKSNVKIRETISKGAKSTSEIMLRSLMSEHQLPKLILEYRHLHKAHTTFLTGIAQHIKDGIVRPTWIQTAAATGRIASSNPNLQAIPKVPFSLVLFPDSDNNDKEQLTFRSLYISREGHSFLAADFKHVECRVFAHAAEDTELLNTLATSDDLFRALAAKWLKKPEDAVVVEDRERTKRLVYASLYGAGVRKLMEILDVSYDQALQVAASFNRTFPSLKAFGRGVVQRCRAARGRLASCCGRVRRLHYITSEHFALRAHAERQAVNFIVQGSAADLCKIAMIQTEERLRSSTPPIEAYLVLQIHDELVWEVKDHDVHRAAGVIKQVMEACGQQCGLAVSLPVTVSVGNNWGQMHDYTVHTQ